MKQHNKIKDNTNKKFNLKSELIKKLYIKIKNKINRYTEISEAIRFKAIKDFNWF